MILQAWKTVLQRSTFVLKVRSVSLSTAH